MTVLASAGHEPSCPHGSTPRTLVGPDLFARLVARISSEHGLSADQATLVMEQAVLFLWTCAHYPDTRLEPSRQVDIGWHTFILYTKEYAEFCRRVAGRFIHHVPDDVIRDATSRSPQGTGASVTAMRALGLHVEPGLWVGASECSQCYAGCADDPRTGDGQ